MQEEILNEKKVNQQEEKPNEKQEEKLSIGSILKTIYMCVTILAALLTFSAATYAWFSSNSVVNTNKVTGKTGTDSVELQISSYGGGSFQAAKEAALVQVNSYSSELLMPISTSDLRTFVISNGTVDGVAVSFKKIEKEKHYYHGRIYLKAASEGHSENAKLALYLDSSASAGGSFATNVNGYIANAARLGLIFDGRNTKILRLSDSANPKPDQIMNAKVNGVDVMAGQVINGSTDPFQIVSDPSAPISQYMVSENGLTGVTPLLMMDLNRIYAVDVYFYLEGCDPDCSDVTRLDSLNLHLAFYGVLTEEAN